VLQLTTNEGTVSSAERMECRCESEPRTNENHRQREADAGCCSQDIGAVGVCMYNILCAFGSLSSNKDTTTTTTTSYDIHSSHCVTSYMHTHTHTHIHTHTHMHMHSLYTYTQVYVCVYVYVCADTDPRDGQLYECMADRMSAWSI
jgi:hypothetical protein